MVPIGLQRETRFVFDHRAPRVTISLRMMTKAFVKGLDEIPVENQRLHLPAVHAKRGASSGSNSFVSWRSCLDPIYRVLFLFHPVLAKPAA